MTLGKLFTTLSRSVFICKMEIMSIWKGYYMDQMRYMYLPQSLTHTKYTITVANINTSGLSWLVRTTEIKKKKQMQTVLYMAVEGIT